MADTYTTTSHQSYGSRLGGAIKGVLVGAILFIASFPLLFWNEGRAVNRYKALAEGEKSVLPVDAAAIDSANEGKLVHFSGRTVCPGVLNDPDFTSVVVSNELRLIRSVEMYQWTESSHTEKKQNVGGSEDTVTTYTYRKEWKSSVVNSSNFAQPDGHINPGAFPYEKNTVLAENVTVGAFAIPTDTAATIGDDVPLSIPGTNAPAGLLRDSRGYYLPAMPRSVIGAPQVGDLRITFSHVPPTDASFVAKQIGGTICSYPTKHGSLLLVEDGIVDAASMFQSARQANKMLTWLLRLVGFIVMLIGLNMIFRPLSVLASVLPFLGRVVGAGTGLISFLIAAICSLVTIALAWLVYRPLISVPLLIIAVALAVVAARKLKGAKESSHESK